jgi:hypothetical protein
VRSLGAGPPLEASLAEAQATLRDRPRLERERNEIGRLLEKDLGARGVEMAVDPPEHVIELLGSRPERGAVLALWDDAAARIDQHCAAFESRIQVKFWSPHGGGMRVLTASQAEAAEAHERLYRSLGLDPEIEPQGLELDIGF